MPLDDYTRAELRRSALDYVRRQTAEVDVPMRLYELRYNINRLDGRDGRAQETLEQNRVELEYLEKLAVAMGLPTDPPAEAPQQAPNVVATQGTGEGE